MAFSIIAIDLEQKLNISRFLSYLKNIPYDFEVLYCSSKKVENKNIKNFVFDKNEGTEQIINAVSWQISCENLIVIRDISKYEKISELISNYSKSNQIVYLKRNLIKFKKVIFNFANIIGKIYMHKLLPMDYGIVLYGEMATKVLKNISSPSVLMRTNNWSGVDAIPVKGGEQYKFNYNKIKAVATAVVPFTISILMIILYFALNFNFFITLDIVYFSVAIFILFISCIFGFKWILNSILG